MRVSLQSPRVAFMGSLVWQCPVLWPMLEEHLIDMNGEFLPHLLLAEVERWTEVEIDSLEADRVLSILEGGLETKNEDVSELIWTSFVENISETKQGSLLQAKLGPLMTEALKTIESS